jgi:hypothetical protein
VNSNAKWLEDMEIKLNEIRLRKKVKWLLWFFIVALSLSGITAFPLKMEVEVLHELFGAGSSMESVWPSLSSWISYIHLGVTETSQKYPFIAYGTDWLAFAHIVIAIAFIGPLRDPVKNIWVVEFGMIACVLVIPLALICGPTRGIPLFWRLIDCSFGVFGFIPLFIARRHIKKLAYYEKHE